MLQPDTPLPAEQPHLTSRGTNNSSQAQQEYSREIITVLSLICSVAMYVREDIACDPFQNFILTVHVMQCTMYISGSNLTRCFKMW